MFGAGPAEISSALVDADACAEHDAEFEGYALLKKGPMSLGVDHIEKNRRAGRRAVRGKPHDTHKWAQHLNWSTMLLLLAAFLCGCGGGRAGAEEAIDGRKNPIPSAPDVPGAAAAASAAASAAVSEVPQLRERREDQCTGIYLPRPCKRMAGCTWNKRATPNCTVTTTSTTATTTTSTAAVDQECANFKALG